MDYLLKDKLAFVTAGAYGIGAAVATLLAQEGVSVIVADVDEVALQEIGSSWTGEDSGEGEH
jgi:NAD(P)-dependent dehydrogenase (short-subunit alcohol dehydrogenase family)